MKYLFDCLDVRVFKNRHRMYMYIWMGLALVQGLGLRG